MSFQSLGKKSHDDFRHLKKNSHEHVTFSDSAYFKLKRLWNQELSSSFDCYIWNIRSIEKIRTTEESLNAKLSDDVKFDSNILKI